jgi:hypothetical protein
MPLLSHVSALQTQHTALHDTTSWTRAQSDHVI